jgi:hypothetical protein
MLLYGGKLAFFTSIPEKVYFSEFCTQSRHLEMGVCEALEPIDSFIHHKCLK